MAHAEAYLVWNAVLSGISLLLGGKLAGLDAPPKKCLLLCALLGGVGALAGLYLPHLQTFALFLCPLSVWACYRSNGMPACARAMVTTACAAVLVGGCGELLIRLGQPPMVSLSLAALLTLLLFALCVLLPTAFCEVKQVEITVNRRSLLLPAMLDSGNLVRDPLTSQPVIVVPAHAVGLLFPEYEAVSLEALPPGFRLLRVRTAAGTGLWPMFRPDSCRVYLNGESGDANAMVAVAGEAYGGVQALVPLAAVSRLTARLSAHGAKSNKEESPCVRLRNFPT